ncbi:hypothetical protein OG912_32310 [Streptomyces sp. NBC_00464]|uniref:hypothetical protein n=1 Tax=Streptomyces sp. NBC_00464 TaxID=2975751 RepID=UPI002E176A00
MTEPYDMTDDVQDVALDTLADWIDGYATPVDGRPQLRFKTVALAEDGHSIDVRVETCDPFPSDPRHFRITLAVEKL